MADWKTHGPSTYLHAGASKVGWPDDHRIEDTYEAPPYVWRPGGLLNVKKTDNNSPQYSAAYTGSGKVILILETPDRTIAHFDTYADAQTAAKALNENHGY